MSLLKKISIQIPDAYKSIVYYFMLTPPLMLCYYVGLLFVGNLFFKCHYWKMIKGNQRNCRVYEQRFVCLQGVCSVAFISHHLIIKNQLSVLSIVCWNIETLIYLVSAITGKGQRKIKEVSCKACWAQIHQKGVHAVQNKAWSPCNLIQVAQFMCHWTKHLWWIFSWSLTFCLVWREIFLYVRMSAMLLWDHPTWS